MSKQFGQSQLYPSAPPQDADEFHRGAPPPSYEESLRMAAAPPVQQHFGSPYYQTQQQQSFQQQFPMQQQQQSQHTPPQLFPTHPQPNVNYANPAPSAAYGYTNPYQVHMQQQQTYYNTATAVPNQMSPAHNVLHFHKRAEIRTTAAGAISVPPPPPGCAPTPGQLAAMTGQPVMVKKDKKKFFF